MQFLWYNEILYLEVAMQEELKQKVCRKCKDAKLLSEFVKDGNTKDGYTTQCKTCRYASTKIWADANPDKVKLNNDNNKEKRKLYYSDAV